MITTAPTKAILEEKYTIKQGQAFLSGTQALVRLPMMQKQSDRRVGLNTAGFISGYRGSPLAGFDQQLWRAREHLSSHDIVFQPGVNEDLAATAVWGTQQTNLYEHALYDGVFGMWYGKGPGADRSTDAIKHANAAGTSRQGGVLMVVGDDHGAKSSTLAHQSEHLMSAAGVPVLYPSCVQEFLDFGLHGWAMSRYSGLWAGLKCVTQVVETSASVDIDPERVKIITPDDFEMPVEGLNIRWPDPPLEQEARMLNYKWYAALAYVRANKLNKVVIDSPRARFGIITAGKAYQDVRQAFNDLGLDKQALSDLGIRVMKVGCVWPLDAQDARQFAQGLDEILVVEEKRQILEYALKEELYNWREDVRPKVYGKFDARGNAGGEWSVPRSDWLLPATAELSPSIVAKAIAKRLTSFTLPEDVRRHIAERIDTISKKEREAARPRITAERKPWFCSGCPHNTSTRVPEGSRAMAGIGCHYMVHWMNRNTETFSHMGGEGIAWLGQMNFSGDKHVFANLGDGTYFHSGLLAIRAAVAAKANITYKILFNDAIAMTGGQPIDGTLTVPRLINQVNAEGVVLTVVVTDDPTKYHHSSTVNAPDEFTLMIPTGVDVYHRDELDEVQKRLREVSGTTVLIYEQMCATEKRRRRKRGTLPTLSKRVFINDEVCEGCGDCSKASNCLSIEPVKTEWGTKRKINQSSCNQDFSCIKGFCPSFVSVEGAELISSQNQQGIAVQSDSRTSNSAYTLPWESPEHGLSQPKLPSLDAPYRIIITGVGGTGVVTVGALLGMAAHLEKKGVSVLDMTGLAQKGGAVISHVQLAQKSNQLHASRIAMAEANLMLGCDSIVSSSADALSRTLKGLTQAVVNSSEVPTASFVQNPDWAFPGTSIHQDIHNSIGEECAFIDANALALTLLGNSLFSNALLVGFAWQKGWIPLKHSSLLRAIEINGVEVEKNSLAFNWGRYFALNNNAADFLYEADLHSPNTRLDVLLEQHEQKLLGYQNKRYAKRYRKALEPLMAKERELTPDGVLPVTTIAAKTLVKLMTFKDEYEVARLYSTSDFKDKLRRQFAGEPGKDYQLKFHMAPPAWIKADQNGRIQKRDYGAWLLKVFPILASMKFVRGTPLDVFGYSEERQQERSLIDDYIQLIGTVASQLKLDNLKQAEDLLGLAQQIRGFGHVKVANIKTVQKLQDEHLKSFASKSV